jgi:uncharacterized protein YndB with AHSA1/START domain
MNAMRKDEEPVIVEQTFESEIHTVWDAITNIDLMRRWYFENIPDFKAEVGFKTRFTVTSEGRDFPDVWKVTEVVPRRKIAYDWHYESYPGDSFVVFELSADEGSTHLMLTHHVRESFPYDVPEFRRESCVAGWEYFIKQRLRAFLEKTPLA